MVSGIPAFSQRARSARKSARKIKFPVEQRVTTAADVGEKDPDLTILDLFGAATLLMCHACRLVAPLGKAGLVDGHHGIRIFEVGQDIAAQFVTHAVLIPDGIGEEALHAIGTAFSGLFGQLPAIFARHITQDADAGYKRQRWRGSGRAK